MQINSVYVIGRLLVRPFQVSSMFSVHKRIGFMKHETNKKTHTYMQEPIKHPCTLRFEICALYDFRFALLYHLNQGLEFLLQYEENTQMINFISLLITTYVFCFGFGYC